MSNKPTVGVIGERLVGKNDQGIPINSLTDRNRYDLRDASKPIIKVLLMSNDLKKTLHTVYIKNTRERPDVILFEDRPYEVVDTTCNPPIYREPMVLEAHKLLVKEKQ